jgi:hypothetical protein
VVVALGSIADLDRLCAGACVLRYGQDDFPMRVMVPTLYAEGMLTRSLTVGGKHFKLGELVKVPYGVALQGLATGTFSCLRNEAAIHAEAIENLSTYGPDSWFTASVQTIGKLWDYLQQNRDTPEVPRSPDGETIN